MTRRIDVTSLDYRRPPKESPLVGYASAGNEVCMRLEDEHGTVSYWVSTRLRSDPGEYRQTIPKNRRWLRVTDEVLHSWPLTTEKEST